MKRNLWMFLCLLPLFFGGCDSGPSWPEWRLWVANSHAWRTGPSVPVEQSYVLDFALETDLLTIYELVSRTVTETEEPEEPTIVEKWRVLLTTRYLYAEEDGYMIVEGRSRFFDVLTLEPERLHLLSPAGINQGVEWELDLTPYRRDELKTNTVASN